MLPRWHILFSAIFSILVYLSAPQINLFYVALLFLSSFLIDFDHYLCSVFKTKKIGIFHSFAYHKEMQRKERIERDKGIKERGDFHLFHTVEFNILVGLLGFVWIGFFYVFLGMIFHSLLDTYSLLYEKLMYRREFFLTAWLYRKIKEN